MKKNFLPLQYINITFICYNYFIIHIFFSLSCNTVSNISKILQKNSVSKQLDKQLSKTVSTVFCAVKKYKTHLNFNHIIGNNLNKLNKLSKKKKKKRLLKEKKKKCRFIVKNRFNL